MSNRPKQSREARKIVLSVTLNDCDVQHFRSGGPGGQNQNKRDTGTRIIHRESGARGESREERSQLQNKRTAFTRMVQTPAFQAWMKMKLGGDALIEARVAEKVRQDMHPGSILVETYTPASPPQSS